MAAKKAAAKAAPVKEEKSGKVEELPQPEGDSSKNEQPSAPIDADQVTDGPSDADVVDANQAESAAEESHRSVAEVAEAIDSGSHEFGTGSDRRILLVQAGYDVDEVTAAITKARAKRLGYPVPE